MKRPKGLGLKLFPFLNKWNNEDYAITGIMGNYAIT